MELWHFVQANPAVLWSCVAINLLIFSNNYHRQATFSLIIYTIGFWSDHLPWIVDALRKLFVRCSEQDILPGNGLACQLTAFLTYAVIMLALAAFIIWAAFVVKYYACRVALKIERWCRIDSKEDQTFAWVYVCKYESFKMRQIWTLL
jgi:hypothetical protein